MRNYRAIFYQQQDGAWVAKIPAISGCYVLVPTQEEAIDEVRRVYAMIAEEYREKGLSLPTDTTGDDHV